MSPADVLHKAADGYRTGQIRWGREWFIGRRGCRCALGAVSWAVDPLDRDADPRSVGMSAFVAAVHLADYLSEQYGVPLCRTDGRFDPIETVGGWNDDDGRTVAEVIAALDAAAERVGA